MPRTGGWRFPAWSTVWVVRSASTWCRRATPAASTMRHVPRSCLDSSPSARPSATSSPAHSDGLSTGQSDPQSTSHSICAALSRSAGENHSNYSDLRSGLRQLVSKTRQNRGSSARGARRGICLGIHGSPSDTHGGDGSRDVARHEHVYEWHGALVDAGRCSADVGDVVCNDGCDDGARCKPYDDCLYNHQWAPPRA